MIERTTITVIFKKSFPQDAFADQAKMLEWAVADLISQAIEEECKEINEKE